MGVSRYSLSCFIYEVHCLLNEKQSRFYSFVVSLKK